MREVPTDRALEFARNEGIFFMETSAKLGSNVNRAFAILLDEIHQSFHRAAILQTPGISELSPQSSRTVVLDHTMTSQEDDCAC